MTRNDQESPVPETGTPGLRWRGLETAYGEPTRARSWKRRTQPRGAYGAPRQSSTLLRSHYAPTTLPLAASRSFPALRSQAITSPAAHPAAPLEPQAQHGFGARAARAST